MRVFFIDAENVNLDIFFASKNFKKKDKFFLVSNSNIRFGYESLKFLCKKKFEIYDFDTPSKDYADKIILSLLGAISKDKKIKKSFVVSNDKIFEQLDYVERFFGKKIILLKFDTQTTSTKLIKTKQKNIKIKDFFLQNEKQIMDIKALSRDKNEFYTMLTKTFRANNEGAKIYQFIKKEKYEILENFINLNSSDFYQI